MDGGNYSNGNKDSTFCSNSLGANKFGGEHGFIRFGARSIYSGGCGVVGRGVGLYGGGGHCGGGYGGGGGGGLGVCGIQQSCRGRGWMSVYNKRQNPQIVGSARCMIYWSAMHYNNLMYKQCDNNKDLLNNENIEIIGIFLLFDSIRIPYK